MVPGPAFAAEEFSPAGSTWASTWWRNRTDIFGRTFVFTDPDGNLFRVSPIV